MESSPVPTNAVASPPGYEKITWAPKKKRPFRRPIFAPENAEQSSSSTSSTTNNGSASPSSDSSQEGSEPKASNETPKCSRKHAADDGPDPVVKKLKF